MSEMQTLSLNGRQYTVSDPELPEATTSIKKTLADQAMYIERIAGDVDQNMRKIDELVYKCKEGINDSVVSDDSTWSSQKILDELAIVETASGESLVLSDASNLPLKSLTVYGKSVQDGTPTPNAPVPIVSAGAANGQIRLYIPQAFETATIIRNPRNVTAPVGSKVVFDVVAAGEGLKYQWQYTNDGSFWYNAVTSDGCTEKQMTLNNSSSADRNGWEYRCMVTDAQGNRVYSNPAVLTTGSSITETVYEEYTFAEGVHTTEVPAPNGLPGIPVSSGGNYTDADGQMWLSNTKGTDRDETVVKLLKLTADMGFQQHANTFTMEDGTVLYEYFASQQATDFDFLLNDPSRMIFTHGRYRGTNKVSTTTEFVAGDLFAYATDSIYDCWIGFFVAIPTLEEFNAWLTAQEEAGTPVSVLYKLREPVVTEHDRVESPYTYKPSTTILNDAGAYMEVEYIVDPKTYYDNKFAQLATAIVNNT